MGLTYVICNVSHPCPFIVSMVPGTLPPSSSEGGQVTTQIKPLMASRKSSRKCWNCDKVGHVAKDCWQPKRESWVVVCHRRSGWAICKSGSQ